MSPAAIASPKGTDGGRSGAPGRRRVAARRVAARTGRLRVGGRREAEGRKREERGEEAEGGRTHGGGGKRQRVNGGRMDAARGGFLRRPPRLPDRILRTHASDARSGRARTHEGTGLSLAVAYRRAKLMGGTLEVESEVGVGSTFRLRLLRASNSPGAAPRGLETNASTQGDA